MRASAQALSSVKAVVTFQSGGASAATSADHAPTAESTCFAESKSSSSRPNARHRYGPRKIA